MDTEHNKTTARRLYDLANSQQLDEIGELVTADYVEHDPVPGQGTGREGVMDRFSLLTGALAARFTVTDVVAEGDRVVVRWSNTGTHVGEFAGIPATGRSFTISGIDLYRVEDGLLAEHWHQIDEFGLLTQLGVLPAPEPA